MKKVFLFLVLGLVCTTGMISCGEDDNGGVTLTSITVSSPTLSLVIGGQQQVTATAVPKEATGVSFSWSSSDENVATVNQSGIVVARAVGTATITVSSDNVQATVTVTVSEEVFPLVSISANRPEITKAVDDTAQVIVSAVPPNASGVTYTWTSADENVATVNAATGIITVTGVGTTTITVSGTGTSGSANTTITVVGTIKSLAVADENGEISGIILLGGSTKLAANFDPVNAEVTPEWSSSDTKVATVDRTGFVQVVGLGTAIITAQIGDYSAVYAISTESPLDDAKGWWTFDDPENLGKALIGENLDVNLDVVTVVPGPTATNGAVRGDWVTSPEPNIPNITWHHNLPGQFDNNTKLWNYTVLMDLKVLFQEQKAVNSGAGYRQTWDPLMTVGSPDTRAGIYILWAINYPGTDESSGLGLTLNITGAHQYIIQDKTWEVLNPNTLEGNEAWYRLIFKMTYTPSEDRHKIFAFLDGKPNTADNGTYPAHNTDNAYCVPELEIRVGEPLYFMTNRKYDKRHKGQYDLANLAVWDRALSDEEILALGAVPK
ncbi:MAG: Ig-like domain-containing protein [Prevotellaceae bacterium]|nr:Ig-like domain-containing protein [Prevotellaceae bacterium]